MEKPRAIITAVGASLPDYILTNEELSRMVDTSDEWITTRIGIKERRILKGEVGSSELGAQAVKQLLEKTNTSFDQIDCVLCATVTPDRQFPANANIISDKLGIKNAFSYDINAGCSGFLYALATGAKFIESGSHKKVVVVGTEKMSAIVDYTDRATCAIFGDGAGAVLLEPSFDKSIGIIDSIMQSDGAGCAHLHQKAGGSVLPASIETVKARQHFIYQEGQAVFKAAVSNMVGVTAKMMEKHNIKKEDIDWLIPHQANLRIIDATVERIGLAPEKVMVNIQKYGNTTAATLPLCMWEWEDQLKKGDSMILVTFGAGFTWGSIYLKWAYDGI